MDNNYCPYIYKSIKLVAHSRGKARVSACCEQQSKIVKQYDDIQVFFDELRDQFKRGEKPDSCIRCWTSEKTGIESKRQKGIRKSLFKKNDGIVLADLEFSNKCNLACVTCNSIKSSLWQKQPKFNDKYARIGRDGNYVFDRKIEDAGIVMKYYNENKHTIKRLEFAGGEPTLHDQFLKLYNETDESVEITFTTNTTTNFDKLLNNRSNIKCILSIDGLRDEYEYIRWPGKWKNTTNKLSNIVDRNKIQEVNTVLQIFNILSIAEMSNYFEDYTYKLIWYVVGKRYLDIVFHPLYFIDQCINSLLLKSNKNNEHLLTVMKSKRREWFTIKDDERKAMQKKFIEYVDYLETNRNISYKKLNNEIVNYIDNLKTEFKIDSI